jgi:hypothetical protein
MSPCRDGKAFHVVAFISGRFGSTMAPASSHVYPDSQVLQVSPVLLNVLEKPLDRQSLDES